MDPQSFVKGLVALSIAILSLVVGGVGLEVLLHPDILMLATFALVSAGLQIGRNSYSIEEGVHIFRFPLGFRVTGTFVLSCVFLALAHLPEPGSASGYIALATVFLLGASGYLIAYLNTLKVVSTPTSLTKTSMFSFVECNWDGLVKVFSVSEKKSVAFLFVDGKILVPWTIAGYHQLTKVATEHLSRNRKRIAKIETGSKVLG